MTPVIILCSFLAGACAPMAYGSHDHYQETGEERARRDRLLFAACSVAFLLMAIVAAVVE